MIILNLSLKCDQPYFIYVNSLNFQQWNSNWNIAFFNSPLNSKLRFLNVGLRCFPNSQRNWKLGLVSVALAGLHNFFQFMKLMEYWNFCMLSYAVLPNFSQFTKELENRYFLVSLTFIFCWIVRKFFKLGMCVGEEEPIVDEIASFQGKKCS